MAEKDHRIEQSLVIGQEIQAYAKRSSVIDSMDLSGLKDRAVLGRANIMMGQTFDDGQPVDIVKYAILIMDIQDIFSSAGVKSSSTWLIADHFISDINKDEEKAEVERQAQNRISYLIAINEAFKGKVGIQLSSQLSETSRYQTNLSTLLTEADTNKEFREAALEAVPEDRRNNPDALLYPFEEIATIESMDTDIKVGPAYERKYDEPACDIAPKAGFTTYAPVYATKGFPFGNPNIPENIRHEIEEFGILPYKKDSKKLGKFRIDPVNDTPEQTRELINQTEDIRALIDLIQISNLAKRRLGGKDSEGSNIPKANKQHIIHLRKLAYEAYFWYIYNPLNQVHA